MKKFICIVTYRTTDYSYFIPLKYHSINMNNSGHIWKIWFTHALLKHVNKSVLMGPWLHHYLWLYRWNSRPLRPPPSDPWLSFCLGDVSEPYFYLKEMFYPDIDCII